MNDLRRVVVLVLLAAACKGKGSDTKQEPNVPPHPMPAPAPVPGDWALCKAALEASPKTPATRQVAALIDACKPCGDWTPLLTWATPTEDGGPKRKDIESTMIGCKAYCDPNAKMRFLGGLDDNRGKDKVNRVPWRLLGEFCKDAVSSVPDARFMSAPYFALDRIARDVAARPDGATLLAAIDLPLPAASVTGAGLELPTSAVTRPTTAPSQLTVTLDDLRIGSLPHAKLGANGVTVIGEGYPGDTVKLADLPAALDKLPQPVLVLMPRKMSAMRLVDVLAAIKRRTVQLGLAATSTLPGWSIYGASPVELTGEVDPATLPKDKAQRLSLTVGASADEAVKAIAAAPAQSFAGPPALVLDPTATVESLATVLGALAYKDVKTAVITAAKRSKP
ncbi:hypothetical protein BH11MYX3_BH11MYX3_08790 [soil metagenome]